MIDEKTKTGLEILQAAVLLGVLGNVLLRETPWGLNVLLFIGALAAAFVMLVLRRKAELWNKQTVALNVALVFFAACFVWRDSLELKQFDFLAILTILAILILPSLNIKPRIAGVFHFIIGFIWSGINAAFAPFFLLFGDIRWKSIPQTGWSKHLVSVLRGLAIAAPLILIFGALFVAADAVFQGLVERTFNIRADIIVSHIFLTAFFSWIIAGYLRGAIIQNSADEVKDFLIVSPNNQSAKSQNLSVTQIKDESNEEIKPKVEEKKNWSWQKFDNSVLPNFFTLGAIEVSIVLGLVNLLFLAFVIVQIPYLFGGMDLVQNTPDFKLAEYARRGFGELVAVAALVLPILLVSHWLLRKDNKINETIFRVLAGINILLLFVIMISAAQRLLLLTGNLGYGLTTVRLYPMIFMIWLALIFIWFGLTVLRGLREQFAWGALWSAFFILGAVHVLNPDAFIVRTNIKLMQQGRTFDAYYNANLSDDAIPTLLENLDELDFENRCRVNSRYFYRLNESEQETDIRSFNFSRRSANYLLEENRYNFKTLDCPENTKYYSGKHDSYENGE